MQRGESFLTLFYIYNLANITYPLLERWFWMVAEGFALILLLVFRSSACKSVPFYFYFYFLRKVFISLFHPMWHGKG